MALLGITEEEQGDIFTVLAAILHLGNVSFTTNEKNTATVRDDGRTCCYACVAPIFFFGTC
jgi:myosin heavy subunit